MKALQVIQPKSFTVLHVPTPDLDAYNQDHILVRTHWLSMCGSDIPFFTGGKPFLPYPLRWGLPIHECVGQVVQSNTDSFQSGDWVLAIPEGDCGLAEYFVARANKAVLLADDLVNKANCCLIQPLSTVINGADRLGDISDSTVAVIGLGSIGLMFCWLLRKRGVGRLIGIDPLAFRCDLAKAMGVDQTYPMESSNFVCSALEKTDFQPVDICIEAVGHQMETINDSLQIIKKQGAILAFGVPDQDVYSFEYDTFFRKNAHLMAVVTPEWQQYLEQARDLYLEYEEELSPLITHSFSIQDAEKAFTMYADHADGIIKAIIYASAW